jgi:hypothetical protein
MLVDAVAIAFYDNQMVKIINLNVIINKNVDFQVGIFDSQVTILAQDCP